MLEQFGAFPGLGGRRVAGASLRSRTRGYGGPSACYAWPNKVLHFGPMTGSGNRSGSVVLSRRPARSSHPSFAKFARRQRGLAQFPGLARAGHGLPAAGRAEEGRQWMEKMNQRVEHLTSNFAIEPLEDDLDLPLDPEWLCACLLRREAQALFGGPTAADLVLHWLVQSRGLAKLGRWDEAQAAFSKVIELRPTRRGDSARSGPFLRTGASNGSWRPPTSTTPTVSAPGSAIEPGTATRSAACAWRPRRLPAHLSGSPASLRRPAEAQDRARGLGALRGRFYLLPSTQC